MKKIKVGDHVKIVNMEGEPAYTGRAGIVQHIDDAGQIHGTWGGCALIPGIDVFEVLETDDDFLCPLGGDETNDCANCFYAGDYHFVDGECVLREEVSDE